MNVSFLEKTPHLNQKSLQWEKLGENNFQDVSIPLSNSILETSSYDYHIVGNKENLNKEKMRIRVKKSQI